MPSTRLGRFADDRESLGQQIVEIFFLRGQTVAELLRLGAELLVRQSRNGRLKGVDLVNGFGQPFDFSFVGVSENLFYQSEHNKPLPILGYGVSYNFSSSKEMGQERK